MRVLERSLQTRRKERIARERMLEDSLRLIEERRVRAGGGEQANADAEEAKASIEVVHGMEIDQIRQQEEAAKVNLVRAIHTLSISFTRRPSLFEMRNDTLASYVTCSRPRRQAPMRLGGDEWPRRASRR